MTYNELIKRVKLNIWRDRFFADRVKVCKFPFNPEHVKKLKEFADYETQRNEKTK